MMRTIKAAFRVAPGTMCFRFECGHERILSDSDARKLERDGDERARCVECERQEAR